MLKGLARFCEATAALAAVLLLLSSCPSAPTCDDREKNGAETDVDCGGGTCPTCTAGKTCLLPSDCQSGVCTGGICQAPSCTDSPKNGTETDVDCGGSSCPKCADGRSCLTGADCTSGVCTAGICQGSIPGA